MDPYKKDDAWCAFIVPLRTLQSRGLIFFSHLNKYIRDVDPHHCNKYLIFVELYLTIIQDTPLILSFLIKSLGKECMYIKTHLYTVIFCMSENLPYGLLKQCSTINKLFIELEIITRNNFFVIVIHKHINLTKPESELHDGMSYEPRPKFHATKITSHVSNHS